MIKATKRERQTNQVSGPIRTQSSCFQEKSRKKSRATIWTQRSCARVSHFRFLTFVPILTLRVRFSRESSLKRRKPRKSSHRLAMDRWGLSIQRQLTKRWRNNRKRLHSSSLKTFEMAIKVSSRFKRRNHTEVNKSKIKKRGHSLKNMVRKIPYRRSKLNRKKNNLTLIRLQKNMEMMKNSISERQRWTSSSKELGKY